MQSSDGEDGRLMHGEMNDGGGVIILGTVDAATATQSPGSAGF